MKYPQYLFTLILLSAVMVISVPAQQPTKIKRPVKNPPQFPNIIDLDDKSRPAAETQEKETPPTPDQSEALARAFGAHPHEAGAHALWRDDRDGADEALSLPRKVYFLSR